MAILLLLILPFLPWGPPDPTVRSVRHSPGDRHDIHVSKCLVEYNEKVRRLQISLHIFLDDLEEALRRRGAENLRLCDAREAPDAETHLLEYVRASFSLAIGERPIDYAFLGKEPSDDLMGVWIYLETDPLDALPNLTVRNTVLLEIFDDQKNIVSLFGPENRHGVLWFERGKTSGTAEF